MWEARAEGRRREGKRASEQRNLGMRGNRKIRVSIAHCESTTQGARWEKVGDGRWDSRAGKGQAAASRTQRSLVCLAGHVAVCLAE